MNEIENFSRYAINIIAKDIMELDIIVPTLIFDYSKDPNIGNGYYMYKNVSGNMITINMNAIMAFGKSDDIKTVITYGFIHEIHHMFQMINRMYNRDSHYHNMIEDKTDVFTIHYIRNNLQLIESRLHFKFNDVFLIGIEKQIQNFNQYPDEQSFEEIVYNSNTIAGALCRKLNINYDSLISMLYRTDMLTVIFPNKREYNIDLNYDTNEQLDILINLIYLEDFNIIKIENANDSIMSRLVFKLY